jgi:uncharacterized protein YbaA (DUF1428 family)
MAQYVDGFVLPVPKRNLEAYRRLSRKAGRVWMDHGALDFRECVGDELVHKGMLSFLRMAKAKPGETVFFSYIVYRSKAHRDRVIAKAMKDPRLAGMDPKKMPFDSKRMAMGGFRVLVRG